MPLPHPQPTQSEDAVSCAARGLAARGLGRRRTPSPPISHPPRPYPPSPQSPPATEQAATAAAAAAAAARRLAAQPRRRPLSPGRPVQQRICGARRGDWAPPAAARGGEEAATRRPGDRRRRLLRRPLLGSTVDAMRGWREKVTPAAEEGVDHVWGGRQGRVWEGGVAATRRPTIACARSSPSAAPSGEATAAAGCASEVRYLGGSGGRPAGGKGEGGSGRGPAGWAAGRRCLLPRPLPVSHLWMRAGRGGRRGDPDRAAAGADTGQTAGRGRGTHHRGGGARAAAAGTTLSLGTPSGVGVGVPPPLPPPRRVGRRLAEAGRPLVFFTAHVPFSSFPPPPGQSGVQP